MCSARPCGAQAATSAPALAIAFALSCLGAPAPAEESVQEAARTCAARDAISVSLEAQPGLTWATIQAGCQETAAAVWAADPVGASWFANAGNGFVGTPLVLLKLLPEIAPEIFGDAKDFGRFGLFPDPDDPDRILPRGLGVTGSRGRRVNAAGNLTGEIDYGMVQPLFVTLACGACHSGRVDLGDRALTLEGAPNTQFDVRKWRAAFTEFRDRYLAPDQIGTAEAPGPTTVALLNLARTQPDGFFARGLPGIAADEIGPVDAAQRAIFAQNAVPILTGFAQGTAVRAAAVALQTRPGASYGHGEHSPGLGGHSAGQSDGSGDLLADLLASRSAASGSLEPLLTGPLPPELPRFATVTDIPSVWNQADRSVGQWDGSVLERFWRNIAAQLPIIGDPKAVDLQNAAIVAEFLLALPPPPYPFDVDLAKAARGETLFAENCGGCHRPRNEQRYPEIGTDMNRAAVLNPAGSALFLAAFQSACHDPGFSYSDRDGRLIRPCVMPPYRILRDTAEIANQGYLAPPLDGLWARAPYLHNGSVPTLRQLLQPASRPDRFLRGVISYDPDAVGWQWDVARQAEFAGKYPTVSIEDTNRDGWGNRGHDRDLVVDGRTYRLDWSGTDRAEDLDALVEYLKTR